jgi:hypothetical protein
MKNLYVTLLLLLLGGVVNLTYLVHTSVTNHKYTLVGAFRTPPLTTKNTDAKVLTIGNLGSLETCRTVKRLFVDYEMKQCEGVLRGTNARVDFHWQQIQCLDQTTGEAYD